MAIQISPNSGEPSVVVNVAISGMLSNFSNKNWFVVLARKLLPSTETWGLSSSPEIAEVQSSVSSIGGEDIHIEISSQSIVSVGQINLEEL